MVHLGLQDNNKVYINAIMKEKLLIFIFFHTYLISYSQWEIKTDTNYVLCNYKINLLNFYPSGEGIFCGLYPDDDAYTYTYYKRTERKDLIYFKELSLQDSSYILGFIKLKSTTIYDNTYECWVEDLIWLYFDKNNTLIKQEFYSEGEIVKPQDFKVPKWQ